MYKLRDYQLEASEIGLKALNSDKPKNAVLVLPCGTGKSLVIADIADKFNKPLLCLQPSKELLEQNYEKFVNFGAEATIYSNSVGIKEVSKLTFATPISIANAISEIQKYNIKHVIIDECALGIKKDSKLRKFLVKAGVTNIVGLTATPLHLESTRYTGTEIKMINRTYNPLFKSLDYVLQIKDVIEKGYWTPINYKILNQDGSVLKVNSSGSDFSSDSLKEYYQKNSLEDKILNEVQEQRNRGKKHSLVFVSSVEEALSLQKRLGFSEVVSAKTPTKERALILKKFKEGRDIKTVINVETLTTGFDFPELDAVIIARSTMSIMLYYQIIGRIVRLHENKKESIVVDFGNNYSRFGRIEDLNYEYIPNYGWGLFNKDTLITDYPIASEKRPTKQTLSEKYVSSGVKMYFGKYKGIPVTEILKKDKGYLIWLVNPDTAFMFETEEAKLVELEIKKLLKIE